MPMRLVKDKSVYGAMEGPFVEFNQTCSPYTLRIEDNAKFKNRFEEFVQEQFKKKLRFIFSNEFPLTIVIGDIHTLHERLPDRNKDNIAEDYWVDEVNSFRGVRFDGVDFRHVRFVNGNFSSSSFRCAKLAELDTRGVTYSDCDFTDAVIHDDSSNDILKIKSSGICCVENIKSSCYASTACLILHISFQAAFDAAR
ncbi:MAG: pentapeptide repeat-containing protein [Planctomycetaceae bacterium]|nr:pentapeptide repeat-containing protein [Planctomycetaceae bacterium]